MTTVTLYKNHLYALAQADETWKNIYLRSDGGIQKKCCCQNLFPKILQRSSHPETGIMKVREMLKVVFEDPTIKEEEKNQLLRNVSSRINALIKKINASREKKKRTDLIPVEHFFNIPPTLLQHDERTTPTLEHTDRDSSPALNEVISFRAEETEESIEKTPPFNNNEDIIFYSVENEKEDEETESTFSPIQQDFSLTQECIAPPRKAQQPYNEIISSYDLIVDLVALTKPRQEPCSLPLQKENEETSTVSHEGIKQDPTSSPSSPSTEKRRRSRREIENEELTTVAERFKPCSEKRPRKPMSIKEEPQD